MEAPPGKKFKQKSRASLVGKHGLVFGFSLMYRDGPALAEPSQRAGFYPHLEEEVKNSDFAVS
jgi:hypothetical protein